jgi:nucleoside-specific outer membrane channel protein Tsx
MENTVMLIISLLIGALIGALISKLNFAKQSKEEINALAKKWIQSDKMNILLVGDKEKVLPGLQKFGLEIIELDADGNKK